MNSFKRLILPIYKCFAKSVSRDIHYQPISIIYHNFSTSKAAGRVVIGKEAQNTKTTQREAPVYLTDEAAKRIAELLKNKAEGTAVRIGVEKRGCNGHSYTMDYVAPGMKGRYDEEVIDKGVRVVIDSRAIMFILGTTIDYREDEISAEFVFNNPLATSSCGCGESFNIK